MIKAMQEQPWSFSLCVMLALAALSMPEMALATEGGTVIGNVLCGVVAWFTGPVGKGIATLAIIIIGIGALMGKVSWGMAIIVGIGVAVIFGAEKIVGELGAGPEGCKGLILDPAATPT